jgi:L,D-transpeptidase YcbB
VNHLKSKLFFMFCILFLSTILCKRSVEIVPVKEYLSAAWLGIGEKSMRIQGELLMAQKELSGFYQRRGYDPCWSENGRPRPCADSLIRQLSMAEQEGLPGSVYHLTALATLQKPQLVSGIRKKWNAGQLADLDILLSDAFLLFASHLQSGRVNPRTFDAEWFVRRDSADVVNLLEEAVRLGDVNQRLRDLRPRHPSYHLLCQALARYRKFELEGGWPQVDYVAKLEPGAHSPRVAQVRRRLTVTGEYLNHAPVQDSLAYDESLVAAVKVFQLEHGLEADGIIGWSSVQEMNVSAEQRCTQIRVNLERWRWLYRDLGERYILVNIPTFEMQVVDQDSTRMSMNVVVGQPARRTPVLSDIMTHLVLNPHWNVPVSIILQEMIPQIRRQPSYLTARNIHIYPHWDVNQLPVNPDSVDWQKLNKNNLHFLFQQEPGPENALGRVKFLLHNEFDVYLHDTPSRGLFARADRALSHGCIRLQKPVELAAYLLRDSPEWTRENIDKALQSSREMTIILPKPYNVHLQYWTAWINRDGELRFGRDVYERDQRVAQALAVPPPGNTNQFAARL